MIHRFTRRQMVQAEIEKVWDFFSTPANLNLLTPPSLHFRILSGAEHPIYDGQIITYSVRILPLIRVHWATEIKNVVPLRSFMDEQRIGPYKFWHHHHRFVPTDAGIDIIDTVHYSLGLSVLGDLARRLWVKGQLEAIFDYRSDKIEALFSAER